MVLTDNRFVVMYSTSTQGFLVVGEVSFTNVISFGTAVAFNNCTSDMAIATIDVGKVALAYRNLNGISFVQVAAISETTIAYGTAVQFGSTQISLGIAAFSNVIVASSVTNGGNRRGNVESFVVNGTTATSVTEAVFNYAATGLPSITKLGTNDFVIAYIDNDNDGFGTVINGQIDPATGEILRLDNEVVFQWSATI